MPDVAPVARAADRLAEHLGQALFGLEGTIRLLLAAMLVDGHVLLEEVPGTGKTTLAKALARALGLDFARLQFTPDLLPSDVTGLYWFNQQAGEFVFRPGPIFAQVLLADELNRATPRTQSALLEAMAEGQVTIEGRTHALPRPFLVLATQNPVELEGTFPLPEAQLDRFLMRLALGYPGEADEHAILRRHAAGDGMEAIRPLPELADLAALRATVRAVHLSDAVRGYLVDLVRATRELPEVELGASPRGALYLHRAAQARAAIAGRVFVTPDDVQDLALPVLAHRLRLEAGAQLRGQTAEALIQRLIEQLPVPVEDR